MKKSYATVTDLFCGAGGSSLGAVAGGAEVSMANKREQVKQCGNAVTPPAMAILIERCLATLR